MIQGETQMMMTLIDTTRRGPKAKIAEVEGRPSAEEEQEPARRQ
jgi:hypothetical protein